MYNEGSRHPIENGFEGTLPVIQYKSVRESSYIWQYDTNEDLSENIPEKIATAPSFNNQTYDSEKNYQ